MELIEWIQAAIPLPVITYGFPLLIVTCFWLAFGDWLYPKWLVGSWMYGLSLLSLPIVEILAPGLSLGDRAIVSGIGVPALWGFGFLILGLRRSLQMPSGSAGLRGEAIARRKPGRKRFVPWDGPAVQVGRQVWQLILGALVGGVLGLLLGATCSGMGLAALALVAPPMTLDSDGQISTATVQSLVSGGMYPVGMVGVWVGALVGLRQLSLHQVIDRLLIGAVIYSAMMMLMLKKWLAHQLPWLVLQPSRQPVATSSTSSGAPRIMVQERPTAPPSDTVTITTQGHTLVLRCRTYRSTDWVGIGFNGFYNLAILGISGVALARGTWDTVGAIIGLLLLLGAAWTMHSATRLFNTTQITLTPQRLVRCDSPLLISAQALRLPLARIAAIKACRSHSNGQPQSNEYGVYVFLINGRRIPLLKHLAHWEAVYVEEQIAQFRRTALL